MIELSEKDVRVVGNARFFRKWRWRMVASIVPFAVSWGISWVLLGGGGLYLSTWQAIAWVAGLAAAVFAPAIYWDRRQRREVKTFVVQWKATMLH